MQRFKRVGFTVGLVTVWLGGCLAADATAARVTFGIAAGAAPTTLKEFATQAHMQLLFDYKAVKALKTPALEGQFEPGEALKVLLQGSGLTFRQVNDHTIAVMAVGSEPPTSSSSPTDTSPADSNRSGLQLAQATVGQTAGPTLVGDQQPAQPKSETLEEILVTAQRRGAERLLDTPISVTALDAASLSREGINSIPDLATSVPGMQTNSLGAGITNLSLRGVTAGSDVSATTAIYYDDVPVGAGQTNYNLDAALFDLERIEVLRGPQGTQYGVSSMGGLLKYVTKLPDLTSFSGTVQSGLQDTHEGGIGFNAAAAVNAPLIPGELGFRAAVFETHDGGFIDNVQLKDPNANRSDTYGARLDILFQPIDALSIRIGGVNQTIEREGAATADYFLNGPAVGQPVVGALDQVRYTPEPFTSRFNMVNGTVSYDFGAAKVTSITSYQEFRDQNAIDSTQFDLPLPGYPQLASASSVVGYSFDKFTQELRIASARSRALDWVVGAFYSHTSIQTPVAIPAFDSSGNPVTNVNLYSGLTVNRNDELAGFGDLTVHLTKSLELTGGIRFASLTVAGSSGSTGLFAGGGYSWIKATSNATTYLANASYHLTPDEMLYLRYATGYRPGGPNNVPVGVGPQQFNSDSLKSYEGGYKAALLDKRIGIDFDVYYVDWSDIQVNTGAFSNGVFYGYNINAPGGANVKGAELALRALPAPDLSLSATFTYIDAYLRQATPEVGASAGEPLPNVPRFTTGVGGEYTFSQYHLLPWVGISAHYVDARWASFNANLGSPQYHLPDFAIVDLKGGIHLDGLDLQLYVRNVLNKVGQSSAVTGDSPYSQVGVTQPRTIGLSMVSKF